MEVTVEKLDDNRLKVTLPGGQEIYVRGNYGEGCAVYFRTEDVETVEFESQGDFQKINWKL